jgi:CheY-like chemotaxis protein
VLAERRRAGAVRQADGEPFDLVLTDVRMAGMDVLLRELRRWPDAVVVLMTAYATSRARSRRCATAWPTTS